MTCFKKMTMRITQHKSSLPGVTAICSYCFRLNGSVWKLGSLLVSKTLSEP